MVGEPEATRAATARRVVTAQGGRFSTELGIDVDRGPRQVERWFLAASLFGARISITVVERTVRVLEDAGIHTVADASGTTRRRLIRLLDLGGYTRYDERTATKLAELARVVRERYGGRVARLGASTTEPGDLEAALDALPGWGPVTVQLFLRELRGVWAGADPPIDERASWGARHLRLTGRNRPTITALRQLARAARIDVRDLEAALVRLSLRHRRVECPGGGRCRALQLEAERA